MGNSIAAATLAALVVGSCQKPTAEQTLLTEARSAVLDLLADPVSAHFADDRTRTYPDHGLVCGIFSAKNGTGRLVQDQRYYFLHGLGAAIDADAKDVTFHHPSPTASQAHPSLTKPLRT